MFFCFALLGAKAKDFVTPFGKSGRLIVNENGLVSIIYHKKKLLQNGYSVFKNADDEYTTKAYQIKVFYKQTIYDKFGKGIKFTIKSNKDGLPTVYQHFFCYANSENLFVQLEIEGTDLKSNYLVPLVGTIETATEAQTVKVPFDNDTFIRYEAKPITQDLQHSAELGMCYNTESKKGWVAGSVNHLVWKSAVAFSNNTLKVFSGYTDAKVTRDEMAHASLTGNKISSATFFIGYYQNFQDGLKSYALASKIVEPSYVNRWTKATPIGWNSWGVIASKLNYQNATAVVDYFSKDLPAFRNEDGAAYIDLDSFWDNMVSGDFTQLKKFVAYCKEHHLEPGVYWAPFTDWGFKDGPNRKAEGSGFTFGELWTKTEKGYFDLDGARALDPTHPGTQARIRYVIGKLKDCGFKMIKIDFLGHAAAESKGFHDRNILTGMQAYRIGMESLSNALDNSMLVYAAISPSLATYRYAHMRRIACDAWKSIENTEYTLNSVTHGWWQSYLYDYIDADHLVFDGESQSVNDARLISGLVTGTVILGDDYGLKADWQTRIAAILQSAEIKKVFADGKAFLPVVNSNKQTSNVFVKHSGNETYIAVFNYDKKSASVKFNVAELGLSQPNNYVLEDIINHKTMALDSQMSISFETEGAKLFKLKMR